MTPPRPGLSGRLGGLKVACGASRHPVRPPGLSGSAGRGVLLPGLGSGLAAEPHLSLALGVHTRPLRPSPAAAQAAPGRTWFFFRNTPPALLSGKAFRSRYAPLQALVLAAQFPGVSLPLRTIPKHPSNGFQ